MRVLVAMSGGIDSSITAYLLKEQGYEVLGLTFVNYLERPDDPQEIEFVRDAQAVADFLGIKHIVVDIRQSFKTIVDYFVQEYLQGRTPNPCVFCNPTIKWNVLWEYMELFDSQYIATGHYAIKKFENQRFFISQGVDKLKDQSYFLYRLPQHYLERTLFPLGEMTKAQIRQIAEQLGLTRLIHKRESFDVCFVRSDDYREFIKSYAAEHGLSFKPGNIVDTSGNIVGVHQGIPFYTIGQRRGLGVALGYAAYVKEIRPERNEIVVAPRTELLQSRVWVDDIALMKYPEIKPGQQAIVRVRYRDRGTLAHLYPEQDRIRIEFQQPVFGITPGQSAVFYENEDVIGGGVIQRPSE